MADYIYTMEIRLTPDQTKGVNLVQEVARAAGVTLYLTGGAIRDIISGFTIRDLDFTVQGNPLKLQKDFERAGAQLAGHDDHSHTLFLVLPGNVRAEVGMAHTETYEKVGKPPVITPASIQEDLRRRDFTVNAMALSLNEGSRGLLLDPFNGVADIEAKLIRILQNYSFVEDPSRMIRATRFAARFGWPLEEKTQQRYESAKENNYIDHVSRTGIGHEIAQLAYEEDALKIVRALEHEGYLKVLHSHWTVAKVDVDGLTDLMKTRQELVDLGYTVDASAATMYFVTGNLPEKDVSDLRRLMPRKDLVESWKNLEDDAKELAKRLHGKEAGTPSKTWNLLSSARPDLILFLSITSKQQTVSGKIKNFMTKWRDVQKRLPLPEMTELLITPQLPEYPKIARDVFMLLLDGKLRSQTETMKYLKPFAPPPPPPPPPPRRGRGAKAAAAAALATAPPVPEAVKLGRGKAKKGAPAPAVVAPIPVAPSAAKIPASKTPASKIPASKIATAQAPALKTAVKPMPAKPEKSVKPAKPAKAPKPSPKPAPKPARKPAKPVKPSKVAKKKPAAKKSKKKR